MKTSQCIMLAALLITATGYVDASNATAVAAPKGKNARSNANRKVNKVQIKDAIAAKNNTMKELISTSSSMKLRQAKPNVENLVVENNQINFTAKSAPINNNLSFAPRDFIQSTTPRTISKTIQQQHNAKSGLEIVRPETASAQKPEINFTPEASKAMEVTQAAAAPKLKMTEAQATQTLQNRGFGKKVREKIAAEKSWIAQQDAQGGAPQSMYKNAQQLASRAGKSLYQAGEAVYNAPGSAVRYISKARGGSYDGKFITGETGSLNSAGKSFNKSLELQMNRPTKAKASVLEFDNKMENSSVSDSTISSSEGTSSIAEPYVSEGAAPSYSSRAYQAARAVYHTPGTLARMAIGEKAMEANGYDGNVMQNAPRNLYNAAKATPSAIYNAPGNTVQYLKLGQKDFISGKEGNSLRTFTNARMAKSKPKPEVIANEDVSAFYPTNSNVAFTNNPQVGSFTGRTLDV